MNGFAAPGERFLANLTRAIQRDEEFDFDGLLALVLERDVEMDRLVEGL